MADTPEGTIRRKVWFSETLALGLGASLLDWGEPDEAGFYTPMLTRIAPPSDPAAPLDVKRLAAAIERVLQDSDSRIGGPYAPLDSPIISVRFDRPAYAAAIAREYAALRP